ncbi:helix-turn-helix domain-containing protein [Elizabethkingia miricola]|uniref:helix-turn-helix domain-containing protein n=1 Tax=Elizabethkingia miricola TaxID=172045 RepID=UPI003892B275
MQELIQKAKKQLQNGDIKAIAEKSGISYQTIYKVLNGGKSTRQTEIIKAISDFLQERKNELERLESVLN